MIFSVGFSRLNPKPFNNFTCILQLLQPAGHSANPRPNLALRATVLHRPVRLLLPLTRLARLVCDPQIGAKKRGTEFGDLF
jgi:hypothetical protein